VQNKIPQHINIYKKNKKGSQGLILLLMCFIDYYFNFSLVSTDIVTWTYLPRSNIVRRKKWSWNKSNCHNHFPGHCSCVTFLFMLLLQTENIKAKT